MAERADLDPGPELGSGLDEGGWVNRDGVHPARSGHRLHAG
jgi:hypothetical protein